MVIIIEAEPVSALVGVTEVSDGDGFGVGVGEGVEFDEETAPQPARSKSVENSRAFRKFLVYVHSRSHPRVIIASQLDRQ
jgi:hypothetical protein